ncbi:LacI family DNA-binding transcriptional regulator [Bifidobacterium rousetti]|uniref:LacI family DNA-binding transcriptional regulator n=1 Tax=Bifidobacterium rousetti TaxID=2045439 RepID=UPI001CC32E90
MTYMKTTRKKVTIRDVAQQAGVSYGTVSRYLNGNDHVSKDASGRIAEAIRELEYTPNRAAQSLAQQRTLTVALIIQVESNETIVQASVSEAMTGANQTLGDAGYQMVTLIANSDESTERIAKLVRSDFADGYLLFSLSNDNSLANAFLNISHPVVRSEAGDRGDLPYPAVDFTNRDGQFNITRYLLDKDRADLVYVCGPGYSPSAVNRLEGFKRAMGERFDERQVYYADDWEITSGEMAAVEFQPMLDHINGFVCANDNIAVGVINQLTRFGYRVPDDIAVTGFDDSPMAILANPKLTTIRQDSILHGRTMAELLLAMMRGEQVEDHYIKLLPTSIIERQSA